MEKYKFLTIDQITCYHREYLPVSKARKKVISIHQQAYIPFTIEEVNDDFILVSGFQYYNALYTLHNKQINACYVSPNTSKCKCERLLKMLKQGMTREQTSWKFKYTIIYTLINIHSLSQTSIAQHLNVEISEISRYVINQDVPDHIKEQAIHTNTAELVNEICLYDLPSEQKQHYYYLAVTGQLTYFQLYLLLSSYHTGYYGLYT